MMPDMDGVATLKAIRALGGKRLETTTVALTANCITGVREMLLMEGFNDFLAKPIETSELTALLERWVPDEFKKPNLSGDLFESFKLLEEPGSISSKAALMASGGSLRAAGEGRGRKEVKGQEGFCQLALSFQTRIESLRGVIARLKDDLIPENLNQENLSLKESAQVPVTALKELGKLFSDLLGPVTAKAGAAGCSAVSEKAEPILDQRGLSSSYVEPHSWRGSLKRLASSLVAVLEKSSPSDDEGALAFRAEITAKAALSRESLSREAEELLSVLNSLKEALDNLDLASVDRYLDLLAGQGEQRILRVLADLSPGEMERRRPEILKLLAEDQKDISTENNLGEIFKIMVVDSNLTNLRFFKKLLVSFGEVYTVPTAERMFELIPEIKPSLILLDHDQAKQSEREEFDSLFDWPEIKDIPIIMLGLEPEQETRPSSLVSGAVDYLLKPIDPVSLNNRVEIQKNVWLQKHKPEARVHPPKENGKHTFA
ncbi:MAG: hypothetical protein LBV23_02140, partial [Deltaproteobacteria bacterium]|jgi:CheY-like chemotaxis protein|nr:hypothetical protein [Deltaproteobacteria bacterium]